MTPPELEPWLDTVTANLAPPFADRLRRELTSHYLDAYHAHLLRGLLPQVAQLAALRDLGPAREVRRALQRTYPTTHDARRYAHLSGWSRSGVPRAMVALFYAGSMLLAVETGLLGVAAAVTSLLLAVTALLLIPPALRARLPEGRAVLASCAVLFPLQALPPLWGWCFPLNADVALNVAALLGGYLLLLICWGGSLWRKAMWLPGTRT